MRDTFSSSCPPLPGAEGGGILLSFSTASSPLPVVCLSPPHINDRINIIYRISERRCRKERSGAGRGRSAERNGRKAERSVHEEEKCESACDEAAVQRGEMVGRVAGREGQACAGRQVVGR